MRITSGIFRSRIIKAPGGIRPTLDNVRKAIFDILGEAAEGAEALDLFAGSGAMGLEALSRGAASCIFVDNNRASIKATKENIGALVPHFHESVGQGPGRTEVIFADSLAAIQRLARNNAKFDIIFMDPPYYKEIAKKTLSLLADCDILSETGVAVIEHSKHDLLPDSSGGLRLFRTARYGDTLVSFYCKGQTK
ncbi:MAG: 16S rRNA (guanine(966)-N(2))-methyltransferase RsmD [Candidatus Omnitrophica bacterium]|nr:16S rRNA (guanine(966)-N(2))-methyltransferase RsmD [Candidatus Omnitrophota bacterium]MDD5310479.1 16S rRNA (guanine(966)-N(2))-methyltransferase RsmD [Candidatus Omnitrophota bacterium]MDD5546677.1 16S rRNA (guanine(966)-N(2))-methyltransferase RsmD [Candidatus Omnitrophota bacterium]